MSRLTFDQLIPVYRNTALDSSKSRGRLRVSDASLLETLKLIDEDDAAFRDSGIRMLDDTEALSIGSEIALEITPPRTGLGLLAQDLNGLLLAPANRVKLPSRYYLIDERFAYNDPDIPVKIKRYRAVISFIRALSEAAAFVDTNQAEATFLGPRRFRLPINYSASDLDHIKIDAVDELETFVDEKIHRDQKQAILATAVIEMCKEVPEEGRFRFLIRNSERLVSRAQDGYKLFASEFSYEKIRGKTEEAIGEYTNRIHKTFHDIQNQVMGVPVATVIVATQFKAAGKCGLEFWANLAISVGATLFVMLLTVAIYNQLMTLKNIDDDLERQEKKLETDYASVAGSFLHIYRKLKKRVGTHRRVLFAIAGFSWLGVFLTWYIFNQLTTPEILSCLAGP
ncbi:hypothetical protein DSM25559_0370 [Agrobacterium rosae]|uniref:Phage-related membrane protein n=1 Tax=Agrobacterium rosae TaxID=1972867 RepID=A0A1R3T8G1_9HYPH|nr:hypothetical protein DSM25559_0370 [Agrobacterium rosae]